MDEAHHQAGSAVAALQTVALSQGSLQRMKLAVGRQAFDGPDSAPVYLNSEEQARAHRHVVYVNGAGSAGSHRTADLGPGQAQTLAKEVDEQHPGWNVDVDRVFVDGE
jgi:hypothetical protein